MTTAVSSRSGHPAGRHQVTDRLAWSSLAGRLILAGVLGYAALTKITDPPATVRAVRAYQLLPEGLAVPVAHALPAFELTLAVLLLLGVAVRLTATISAVLIAAFFVGVASAAARGLRIDCGCFGGGGPTEKPQYALELFRDAAFLAIAIAVALIPRSRLAVDDRLPLKTNHRLVRGAVAVALVVAAVVGIVASRADAPAAQMRVPAGATAAGGIVVGSATAPHRLLAYEDPQCPPCGAFESTSGRVLAQAIAAGKVSVEYRMRSFLGPESVRAVAALGAASEQGKFSQLHAALYAHQPQEGAGGYTVNDLLDLGRSVGLSDDAYTNAVKKQTFARWARAIDEQASRDGSVSTPDLRLDGKQLDAAVVFDPAKFAAALGVI